MRALFPARRKLRPKEIVIKPARSSLGKQAPVSGTEELEDEEMEDVIRGVTDDEIREIIAQIEEEEKTPSVDS